MSAAQILATEDGNRPEQILADELIPIIRDLYALARVSHRSCDAYASAVLHRAVLVLLAYSHVKGNAV